mmetsp:Transcript_34831/g.84242  ORF Transcript_34831/g.84242 Transcript_34831/m.84242 type:complete len:84 (+) Transcript_34831:907-1158(+)
MTQTVYAKSTHSLAIDVKTSATKAVKKFTSPPSHNNDITSQQTKNTRFEDLQWDIAHTIEIRTKSIVIYGEGIQLGKSPRRTL